MLRMVKIPRQLEIQPELRLDTKQSLQPKRSVRSHVALSMYKLIHTWIRYAEPIRELRLRRCINSLERDWIRVLLPFDIYSVGCRRTVSS